MTMQLRQRLFLIHYRREWYKTCPLCGQPIRWEEVTGGYTPCNKEPVLYIPEKGYFRLVSHGEIIDNCKLFFRGDSTDNVKTALQPHVFTCKKIKQNLKGKNYGTYRQNI